jgi:uncharacterized protein YndB with AHSA1/START domain
MTLIDITKDTEALTITVRTRFAAPVDRVWQLWADPRQLERWWGPPTYPATFHRLDLRPGGSARYSMTGPEGDQHHGWWQVITVDAPHHFEVIDGFGDDTGTPITDGLTTEMHVTLSEVDGGTDMTMHSTFPSLEVMEQMVDMGMEEGLKEALGQIDALLASG